MASTADWNRPAWQWAEMIRSKQISSVELLQLHLDRIALLNPRINAVVQWAPNAMDEARHADAELAAGRLLGPLHGVPFTVKDVFDVAGVISAVGVEARRGVRPVTTAISVQRLKMAGAILMAKTNTPPNGGGGDTENMLYGRTLNPYNLACTPGGSSGGEAALIAAGGSPLGLGSDSGGSLRIPAHYCGIATLKPTFGRVPNTGAYNHPGGLSDPRTQIGPMARSVRDLDIAYPYLCGPDWVDSSVVPMPARRMGDVKTHGLTVAWFSEDPDSPVTPETSELIGRTAQALARGGARLEYSRPDHFAKHGRTLTELYWRMTSLNGFDVSELYEEWDRYRSNFLGFMERYDALLCPVDPHPAVPWKQRDPARFDYTLPSSLVGLPAAVVRAGASAAGLPIGVQIIAKPWREDVALALAAVVERELGGYQAPAGDW